jgi:transcriptional regulator with XRE-family HTH domain
VLCVECCIMHIGWQLLDCALVMRNHSRMTQPGRLPTAPNVWQRQLGMRLRELREHVGLSADQVAEHMSCSQAKVTRIENARTRVDKPDLWMMLDLYGVTDKDPFWALAQAGRQSSWWAAYRDVMDQSLVEYMSFEQAAQEARIWSLATVHGLLQTEDYARATFAGGWPGPAEQIDRVVSARMERQKRLADGTLTLWAILDETILYRPVGGPQVLRGQLEHLLRLPPAVTVQVVPAANSWHPGLSSAFTLMDFAEYPTVGYIEASYRDTYIESADSVRWYSLLFDQLRAAGANPKDSRAMIAAARDKIPGSN